MSEIYFHPNGAPSKVYDLVNQIRASIERLANTQMNMSLVDWQSVSGPFHKAVDTLSKQGVVLRDCHEHLHQLTAIIPGNDQAYEKTTALMARIRALASTGEAQDDE